ncbi:serine hydrolase domain-containing protein [Lentibacillus halodurans]|nr:serine hydrolase domain-containing protein [Lentibacillus halodurans]
MISLWINGFFLLETQGHQVAYGADDVLSKVDAYITDEMKAQSIPGLALGIVKDGRIIHLKGYGQTDSSGQPVTAETPFIIGSNSKSITAMAVLQLVEEGKIDLDAPVQQYIPAFQVVGKLSSSDSNSTAGNQSQDASSQITVRHLLHQTSGLPPFPGDKTVSESYSEADALEKRTKIYMDGRVELNRPVGQSYEYANDNYVLLGLIVQKVTGQSYESYIKEHIFTPLGMDRSFTLQGEALKHGLADPHRRWFGWNIAYTSSHAYSRGDVPAGYIMSSAKDLSHYLIAQLNEGYYDDGSVLSPSSMSLMQTEPVPQTYAMGWLSDKVSGIPVIGHAGGTIGYQSHIWFSPEAGIGVVVLANVLNAMDSSFFDMETSTTTHIASGVISQMMNRTLPAQGLSMQQKYWIVNGLVVLLSAWFLFSLVRVLKRYRRLSALHSTNSKGLVWRAVLIIVLHLFWPSTVLLLTVTDILPIWHVLSLYQPDIILWVKFMAIAVFLKGIAEIGLLLKK